MCGFIGASKNSRVELSSKTIEELKNCLHHRGPDGADAILDGNHILIHNRLSIIDLSDNASQPMKHQDRKIYIVFNGEIYNYQELARKYLGHFDSSKYKSDTRVLLDIYSLHGVSKFSELRGIFAFAIIDLEVGKTVLCRDHFGVKPLVYSEKSSNLFFASEVKGILAISAEEYSCDLGTLTHYFSTGQVAFNGRTFFEGISELEPATVLTYCHKTKQISKEKFFCLEEGVLEKMEDFESENSVIQKLLLSLSSNMMADVPIVVALSSGLDSYTILSVLKQMGIYIPKTYSFGFNERNYDESAQASIMSKGLGIPIRISMVDQAHIINQLQEAIEFFETPLGGVGTFGLYMNCKTMKTEGERVVLTGEGADEIFGGYDYYFSGYFRDINNPLDKLAFIRSFGKLRGLSLLDSKRKLSSNVGKGSLAPDGTFTSILSLDLSVGIENLHDDLRHSSEFSEAQKLQLTDIKFRKLPKLLHFLERSGSANGIESRVPFLDKDLVVSALALSGRSHYARGIGKQVLRNISPNPTYRSPKMKKWVATPQREWLQGDLGEWGIELYQDGLLRRSGYIDDLMFLDRVREYRESKVTPENSFFFWQAINIELLLRNYPKLA